MSSGLPTKILKDNVELIEARDIANAFNNFFVNVGSNIASSIPASSTSPELYLPERQINSLLLSPITSKEISDEICKLNISKASGPYSIPTILKVLHEVVSKPLEYIFNLSLTTGTVPHQLKVAKMIIK